MPDNRYSLAPDNSGLARKADTAADTAVDRAVDKAVDKAADKTADTAAGKEADMAAGKAVDRLAAAVADKAAESHETADMLRCPALKRNFWRCKNSRSFRKRRLCLHLKSYIAGTVS